MAKDLSFLPEDYLDMRIARRTNAICITLFAIVLLVILAAFFVKARQESRIRDHTVQINRRFQEAARRIEQMEELSTQKKQMVRKAMVTSVLVERLPRSLVLAELINHMPTSLSLFNLELETKAIGTRPKPKTAMDREKHKAKKRTAGAGAPDDQVRPTVLLLKMEGVAPTDVQITEYMATLGNHPMFMDLNLQYIEQHKVNNREMRKFGIDLRVNQGINLRQIDPTLVERGLKQNPMGATVQIRPPGSLARPKRDIVTARDTYQGE